MGIQDWRNSEFAAHALDIKQLRRRLALHFSNIIFEIAFIPYFLARASAAYSSQEVKNLILSLQRDQGLPSPRLPSPKFLKSLNRDY